MSTKTLSKNDFVCFMLKEQEVKKSKGETLKSISQIEFNEILEELVTEFGVVKEEHVQKKTTLGKLSSTIENVTDNVKGVLKTTVTQVKENFKQEEPLFKLKEVRGKHGFMQLAFDFS